MPTQGPQLIYLVASGTICLPDSDLLGEKSIPLVSFSLRESGSWGGGIGRREHQVTWSRNPLSKTVSWSRSPWREFNTRKKCGPFHIQSPHARVRYTRGLSTTPSPFQKKQNGYYFIWQIAQLISQGRRQKWSEILGGHDPDHVIVIYPHFFSLFLFTQLFYIQNQFIYFFLQ